MPTYRRRLVVTVFTDTPALLNAAVTAVSRKLRSSHLGIDADSAYLHQSIGPVEICADDSGVFEEVNEDDTDQPK